MAAMFAAATHASEFDCSRRKSPPGNHLGDRLVKITAFMYAYNEADIIGWSVRHLIAQGIMPHVLDNWSTDGTWELLLKIAAEHPQVILERWPATGPAEQVSWFEMLQHTEELALQSGSDWCIHHDADEIRRSVRSDETLQETITRLDG